MTLLKFRKVLPRCSSGNRKRNNQDTFYPMAGVGGFFGLVIFDRDVRMAEKLIRLFSFTDSPQPFAA